MLKINQSSKIYIFAPSNLFTGGPSCLHQLGYVLKEYLKFDVKIFYEPFQTKDAVHINYKKYGLDIADEIEDNSNNILISPEDFFFIKKLNNYVNIQKIIWWLSLDNFYKSYFTSILNKQTKRLFKFPYKIIKLFNFLTKNYSAISTFEDYNRVLFRLFKKNNIDFVSDVKLNLTQSHYVKNYLKKFNCNYYPLFDHIFDNFEYDHHSNFSNNKENIICYNPIKATDFIKNFIKNNKKFKFIPLTNLSPNEIKLNLSKSKIYMDFGSHPGRDKLPREAVIFDNCIITNKRGSAENPFDIPIDDDFKFNENISDNLKLYKKINDIFDNYVEINKRFQSYREIVFDEKKNFINQIKVIFQ